MIVNFSGKADIGVAPREGRRCATARHTRILTVIANPSLIHNRFNQDRHLNRRDNFKQNRATALAEWCQLAV